MVHSGRPAAVERWPGEPWHSTPVRRNLEGEADMSVRETDKERDDRIANEIIVDAYGPEEQTMGWYYYLDEKLRFTFKAKCIAERSISPLSIGETVEVTGMAPEAECEKEMFVMVSWDSRSLAVPLSQLKGVRVDKETEEGIEDWHYWVNSGYEF